MDIDILLALQQFRNGIGGGLAEFLSKNNAYHLERDQKLLPDDSPRDGAYAALLLRNNL